MVLDKIKVIYLQSEKSVNCILNTRLINIIRFSAMFLVQSLCQGALAQSIIVPETAKADSAESIENTPTEDTLTIRVFGDMMMHTQQINTAYRSDGSYNFDTYFTHVQKFLDSSDINIANMEFTLAGKPYSGYPMFCAPDSFLHAAIDAGFCDHDRQIGQTGVTVHPKLYIACGISGQIQHIAGMQDAGIIISINNDPNAPINTIADYVINGSVEEVVPKLIKYYKKNSK